MVTPTNLLVMSTVGPRDPCNPTGPSVDVATYGDAGVKRRPFKDGQVYTFYWPVGSVASIFPSDRVALVIFQGQCLTCFEADGINYLGMWITNERHEKIFPEGPPGHRDYTGLSEEDTLSRFTRWGLDPNMSNPGEIGDVHDKTDKIIEIAQLVESEGVV